MSKSSKSSAAANWNQETKARLNEKITSNITDIGSLTRQIVRGSKSNEFLAQAAKNFVSQENYIHNSAETMKKMDMIRTQLESQHTSIAKSFQQLNRVQEQLSVIQS